jgi:hypothetical protein
MKCTAKIIRFLVMAIGVLTIALVLGFFGLSAFFRSVCTGPVRQSTTAEDQSVKASIYETDCGAMTSRRVNVALSAYYVDGRKYGDIVVTFLRITAGDVHLIWRTKRDLIVTYPASGDVEYAVSKVRGVKIYLQPQSN